MEVKKLASHDMPRTRKLGLQFAEECNLFGGYNPEHFEPVWATIIDSGAGELFYVEQHGEVQGFIGATFYPDLYSGLPSAQLQFWYVAPGYRKGSTPLRLFRAFELEAEARGCRKIFAGHKETFNREAMSGFFERHGFVKGETMYWRNK